MNNRLIRAAIAFYPPDWRQRYGVEMEQLVSDAWAADQSRRLAKLWLIVEVAASGIRERLRNRGVGRRHRIAGAFATTIVASGAVIAIAGSQSVTAPMPPRSPVTLAPGIRLGSLVKEVNETALHGTLGLQHVVLRMDRISGNLDMAVGVPAHFVVNPKTEQVLAVRPAGKH